MATIKYVGGLSSVKAPWDQNLEVARGASVEADDKDAAILTSEPGASWVYVAEVTFSGKVGDQEIEFTPSSKLEVELAPLQPAEPAPAPFVEVVPTLPPE